MGIDFLKGSWVAIITPFNKNLRVDFDAWNHLLDLHLAVGTDGIVVCGTTGEGATLELEEKKELMKLARKRLNGQVSLMFGAGSNDTTQACIMASEAASMGADAILSVTPYYNKPPQSGLITHFKSIAEVTELPVVLYNVPGRTGCNLQPETVAELATVKNICGVKEASGNLEQVQQIISLVPEDFSVFSGEDALNLPIMACGAVGTISVTANVAPDLMKHFNDACLKGDWEKAKKIHYKLLPLHKAMFAETNPLPAKAALSEMGLIQENSRPPLCNADLKTHKLVKKIISSFGEMS
ncbi:MAG: 4-hydroxy-tetrahydrodipicolinate synthase [Candidatus Riflebacteria bacterium]|nr:4-hydroxy-tetrahydrodipicolinate synthase [Candidatus Riflebacteria bacterium]